MARHRVEFDGAAGQPLAGLLEMPDDQPLGYAIFAHCFTCSKDLSVVVNVARQLNEASIAVLRFDFTGLGESEGEFATTSFSTNLQDLLAAGRFLEHKHQPPAMLIGHSLGGAAVLAAAGEMPTVTCVATIGAPSDPTHVRRHLAHADFDEQGFADVSIGGRPFRIGRQFVDDLETHNLESDIAAMNRPLLIFHSPKDTVVSIDHAERIFKAARHPRSFVSLDQADHLVSNRRDAAFLGRLLAAWGQYYVTDSSESS